MSELAASSPEISFQHPPSSGTGRIWKIFWLLSVVTVIELILGLGLAKNWYGEPQSSQAIILGVKGAMCILSLAKAFYIVSVFMHLGDEIRNLMMTIVVPLCLFIWFIAAFLWDGDSWRRLKNTRAGSMPSNTEQHRTIPVEKSTKP